MELVLIKESKATLFRDSSKLTLQATLILYQRPENHKKEQTGHQTNKKIRFPSIFISQPESKQKNTHP